MSLTFAGDSATVRNSEVSVIAGRPQGKSRLNWSMQMDKDFEKSRKVVAEKLNSRFLHIYG